jgi:hypothetical protein
LGFVLVGVAGLFVCCVCCVYVTGVVDFGGVWGFWVTCIGGGREQAEDGAVMQRQKKVLSHNMRYKWGLNWVLFAV